ncbi:MAG: beta-N-acetylhexosaminidase [Lachnospiraceae bacterium]|nr:beta-N-acetylhexosaminidase [Lachnospiraceae bacterium]
MSKKNHKKSQAGQNPSRNQNTQKKPVTKAEEIKETETAETEAEVPEAAETKETTEAETAEVQAAKKEPEEKKDTEIPEAAELEEADSEETAEEEPEEEEAEEEEEPVRGRSRAFRRNRRYEEEEDDDEDEDDDEEDEEEEELTPEERRRLRRRQRRIRNQILAYGTVAVLLLCILFGTYLGVSSIHQKRVQKAAEEQALQEQTLEEEETIVLSEPETIEESEEEIDPLDEIAMACIAEMPLEDKVAGLFIITPEQLTGVSTAIRAGDSTQEALGTYAVGGLIYAKQNIQNADQIKEMLDNTVKMSKYPIFLAVNEEGGKNGAIASSGIESAAASASEVGSTGDAAGAYTAGQTIGSYMNKYGFNLDFAPVADLITNENNTTLQGRTYGSDPSMVSGMVSQMVQGLMDGGASACVKYFPGLGGTEEDTADGMARTERTLEEMNTAEFTVFQAAFQAGAEFVLVSNESAPGVVGNDDTTQCSLSSVIMKDILRDQLGFNGVIVTDAMDQLSITEYYTPDEAAIKAIKAGADMILRPEDFKTAYEGLLEAVRSGSISEERIDESLLRIYRIKYKNTVALTE